MNALEYLEATHIEDIGSQYQNEGYQVVVSSLELDHLFETRRIAYSLMATNSCRKLAFGVVERCHLTKESEKFENLRDQADKEGFYDFGLTILSPPPNTDAQVEALDRELCGYLLVNLLDHLAELPAKVQVQSVGQVEGSGVVEVALENAYRCSEKDFEFVVTT